MMNQVNSPLVSVVIPYFNCEKYIAETLDSVEKQTYPNVEIIVVNDGSFAASTEYLEEILRDKTNILYLSQANQGVSSARNTGAKVAQGEFLLFLDADDKIASQYLQTAVNIMLSKPTCKLVYSNAEFFGEKVGVWNLPQYTTFDKLLQGNMIYCIALHCTEHLILPNWVDLMKTYLHMKIGIIGLDCSKMVVKLFALMKFYFYIVSAMTALL